jgi:hypothetical protein
MRTRRETFGLIPTLPVVSTGAVLAAVLHGGGFSTSGLAAGGSVAGGSIAGGSIAAGTMAAGSLIGGGSFAAIKGLAIAGAIAVAGAGVIVGTGISQRARHPEPSAQVTHAVRAPHVRTATVAAPELPKPVHLASARTHAIQLVPATSSSRVAVGSSRPHHVSAVAYTPPTQGTPVSEPNTQAPAAPVPVATTTPTTSSTPTAPPSSTPTAATPAPTTAPTAGTSSPATASTAGTLWIDSIIESALSGAGADVAAAEAQAEQQLSEAGISASSTIQGLITSILSGGHG